MKNIILGVCFIILAFIAAATLLPAHSAVLQAAPSIDPSNGDSGSQSRYAGSSAYVTGKPTITAEYINRVLCSAQSPACNTGQALYDAGQARGIDPAYALAFFKHESSYGKYGIARDNLGLGNIRCTPGYTCLNGFRSYASWQAGYEDWYALIHWYVFKLNKRTIPDIIPTYAPSSENDTQGYIVAIERAVDAYRRGE